MVERPVILLTGATGFIGSHLLETMLLKEYRVVIAKRSTSDIWRIENLINQVASYDIDNCSLERIFDEQHIDVIIHLATLYRKFDNGKEVAEMINANVSFPVELLELGVRKGVKAFFNTGTFFEYDCSHLPVTEDAEIKPFNLYAKTKLAFESVLKTYSKDIVVNTFRLFSPYGEKDNQKLIPMIIQKGLLGEEIKLSEGFQKLDFIYSADIVNAYIKALERVVESGIKSEYQVFNLGSSSALSVRDVVSVIEEKFNKRLNVSWGEASLIDIPIVYADNSKAIELLGWKPETTIQQGIENTLRYYEGKCTL